MVDSVVIIVFVDKGELMMAGEAVAPAAWHVCCG